MDVRMLLGLAIGLMAMSAVSGFRDNGPQQKWSPYKPRWYLGSSVLTLAI